MGGTKVGEEWGEPRYGGCTDTHTLSPTHTPSHMHARAHTVTYIHKHTPSRTHTLTPTHTLTHTCTHTPHHTHTQTSTPQPHKHACTHACTYACTEAQMHIVMCNMVFLLINLYLIKKIYVKHISKITYHDTFNHTSKLFFYQQSHVLNIYNFCS